MRNPELPELVKCRISIYSTYNIRLHWPPRLVINWTVCSDSASPTNEQRYFEPRKLAQFVSFLDQCLLSPWTPFVLIPSFCHRDATQGTFCEEMGCLRAFYTCNKLRRSSLSLLIRDGMTASLLNFKDVTLSLLDCCHLVVVIPSENWPPTEPGVIYHQQPTNSTNQWRTSIGFFNSQKEDLTYQKRYSIIHLPGNPPDDHHLRDPRWYGCSGGEKTHKSNTDISHMWITWFDGAVHAAHGGTKFCLLFS